MRIKFVARKLESQYPQLSTSQREVITIPPGPSKPLVQRAFDWLGMQSVSDQEYLERLKLKREELLRRIAEIEADRTKESNSKENP